MDVGQIGSQGSYAKEFIATHGNNTTFELNKDGSIRDIEAAMIEIVAQERGLEPHKTGLTTLTNLSRTELTPSRILERAQELEKSINRRNGKSIVINPTTSFNQTRFAPSALVLLKVLELDKKLQANLANSPESDSIFDDIGNMFSVNTTEIDLENKLNQSLVNITRNFQTTHRIPAGDMSQNRAAITLSEAIIGPKTISKMIEILKENQ